MQATIKSRLESVKKNLKDETQLIAVSKMKPASLVREAYESGQHHFGENKVQELLDKSLELKDLSDLKWHFIGRLQSNKINNLLSIPQLVSIHSIDSIKLLNKLLSKKVDKRIGLFLQVNTSFEEEKAGFSDLAHVREAIELINTHDMFYVQGLMTIGKIRTEHFEEDAIRSFRRLNDIKEKLDLEYSVKLELSMGMSRDYQIAADFGASWVRVGSTIFGIRE